MRLYSIAGLHTLLELLHEVSHDLLELRAVHTELILEILDVLQKILRQFVPRTWEWRDKINSGTKLIEVE